MSDLSKGIIIANDLITVGFLAADLLAMFNAGDITEQQLIQQLEGIQSDYTDASIDTRAAIARRRQQLIAQSQ